MSGKIINKDQFDGSEGVQKSDGHQLDGYDSNVMEPQPHSSQGQVSPDVAPQAGTRQEDNRQVNQPHSANRLDVGAGGPVANAPRRPTLWSVADIIGDKKESPQSNVETHVPVSHSTTLTIDTNVKSTKLSHHGTTRTKRGKSSGNIPVGIAIAQQRQPSKLSPPLKSKQTPDGDFMADPIKGKPSSPLVANNGGIGGYLTAGLMAAGHRQSPHVQVPSPDPGGHFKHPAAANAAVPSPFPYNIPGGYQLARDPITGQWFLIPSPPTNFNFLTRTPTPTQGNLSAHSPHHATTAFHHLWPYASHGLVAPPFSMCDYNTSGDSSSKTASSAHSSRVTEGRPLEGSHLSQTIPAHQSHLPIPSPYSNLTKSSNMPFFTNLSVAASSPFVSYPPTSGFTASPAAATTPAGFLFSPQLPQTLLAKRETSSPSVKSASLSSPRLTNDVPDKGQDTTSKMDESVAPTSNDRLAPPEAVDTQTSPNGVRSQGTSPLVPITESDNDDHIHEEDTDGSLDVGENNDQASFHANEESQSDNSSSPQPLQVTTAVQVDMDSSDVSYDGSSRPRHLSEEQNQIKPIDCHVKFSIFEKGSGQVPSPIHLRSIENSATLGHAAAAASYGGEPMAENNLPVLQVKSSAHVIKFINNLGLDSLVDSVEEFAASSSSSSTSSSGRQSSVGHHAERLSSTQSEPLEGSLRLLSELAEQRSYEEELARRHSTETSLSFDLTPSSPSQKCMPVKKRKWTGSSTSESTEGLNINENFRDGTISDSRSTEEIKSHGKDGNYEREDVSIKMQSNKGAETDEYNQASAPKGDAPESSTATNRPKKLKKSASEGQSKRKSIDKHPFEPQFSESNPFGWNIRRSERIFLHEALHPNTSVGSSGTFTTTTTSTSTKNLSGRAQDQSGECGQSTAAKKTGISKTHGDAHDTKAISIERDSGNDSSSKKVKGRKRMPSEGTGEKKSNSAPTITLKKKRSLSCSSREDNQPSSKSHISLIIRTPLPSTKLTRNDLVRAKSSFRVIIKDDDGMLYAGSATPLEPPDVFSVTLDGDRSSRSRIYTQEELLQEGLREVRPRCKNDLPAGTRICAYWSQQYRCLYPGVISPHKAPKNAIENGVLVVFDDKDAGTISLEDIRMLPANYPKMNINRDPLALLISRRRSSKSIGSENSLGSPSSVDGREAGAAESSTPSSKENSFSQTKEQRKIPRPKLKFEISANKLMLKSTKSMNKDGKKRKDKGKTLLAIAVKSEASLALPAKTHRKHHHHRHHQKSKSTSQSSSMASASSTAKDDYKERLLRSIVDPSTDNSGSVYDFDDSEEAESSSLGNTASNNDQGIVFKSTIKTKLISKDSHKVQQDAAPSSYPHRSAILNSDKGMKGGDLNQDDGIKEESGSNSEGREEKLNNLVTLHKISRTASPKLRDEARKKILPRKCTMKPPEGFETSKVPRTPSPMAKSQPLKNDESSKTPKKRERFSSSGSESKSKILAFLPERQLWSWSGKPFRRYGAKGKPRKEFYREVCRGKEHVAIGDCAVFLSTGKPHLPYIGRIDSMWQTSTGNMVVRVRWFYHPEETEHPIPLVDSRGALFESQHYDENDVQTISHKCHVLSWSAYEARKLSASHHPEKNSELADDPPNVYYLAGTYDALSGKIVKEPKVPIKDGEPSPSSSSTDINNLSPTQNVST